MPRKREGLIVLALMILSVGAMILAPPGSLDTYAEAQPTTEMRLEPTVADRASRLPSATSTRAPSPTLTQRLYSDWRTYDSLAGSTATPWPTSQPTPTRFPFDTRPDLDRYIYIDQWTQHMYVFEFGQLVRDIPASCGLPDPDKYTEAWSGEVGEYWGTFYAFDVYADEAWYLYLSAGSILIHSLPYTIQNGYKVYQDRDALGVRPASHGCVRISPEDAAWLTRWNPEGVQATVTDPYLERWRSILYD